MYPINISKSDQNLNKISKWHICFVTVKTPAIVRPTCSETSQGCLKKCTYYVNAQTNVKNFVLTVFFAQKINVKLSSKVGCLYFYPHQAWIKVMITWTCLKFVVRYSTSSILLNCFGKDWYKKLIRARQTTLLWELYSLVLVFLFLVLGLIMNKLIQILFLF